MIRNLVMGALGGIVASLLFIALSECAHAQTAAPAAPDPQITIKLAGSQWNLVLQGLQELPFRIAQPLITEIQAQAQKEIAPPPPPKDEKGKKP